MTIKRRAALSLILFAVLISAFAAFASRIAAQTDYYYLAHWEWVKPKDDFPHWRCPGGDCLGSLDLRSIPQQSEFGGTPQGFGLFVYDHAITCLDCYALGNSLDRLLTTADKAMVASVLDLSQPVASATLRYFIAVDLLINNADPTGLLKWKPIRGSIKSPPTVYLAGEQIWQGELADVLDNTIAAYRHSYGILKSDGMPLSQLQKLTGSKMLSLWGRMGNDLLDLLLGPASGDGWAEPSTTVGDTFTVAIDTDLGSHTATGPNGGFTWTETTGSCLVEEADDDCRITTNGFFRADSDLSSDAHYSQNDVVVCAANQQTYSITRFDSAAEDFYSFIVRNAATNTFRLFKYTGGSPTQVGSTVNESPPSATYEAYLESTAADAHTAKIDGVTKIGPETDSTHTEHYRAGFGGSSTGGQTIDNFEAADLAAAAERRIIIIQ